MVTLFVGLPVRGISNYLISSPFQNHKSEKIGGLFSRQDVGVGICNVSLTSPFLSSSNTCSEVPLYAYAISSLKRRTTVKGVVRTPSTSSSVMSSPMQIKICRISAAPMCWFASRSKNLKAAAISASLNSVDLGQTRETVAHDKYCMYSMVAKMRGAW